MINHDTEPYVVLQIDVEVCTAVEGFNEVEIEEQQRNLQIRAVFEVSGDPPVVGG